MKGHSMNLRHMEVFRAVMSTGSVGGAAELLHISQPAASKLLAQAERHSGLALFDRVKGRLLPTPEAKQLYDVVENLWRGVERVRDVSRALAQPQAGSLRLAVSASLSAYLVPRAVTLLYQRFPHLQCSVETLVPSIMTDTLLDQSMHLGVGMLPNEHPNLLFARSYECGMACVMHRDHPLAARKRIRPADLLGQRVIGSPSNTRYGQVLQNSYGPKAASLRLELQARSSMSACLFASAGAGVAVVDTAVVAGCIFKDLAVRPFATDQKLDVRIIRNRLRPMSAIDSAFCDAFDAVWKAEM
jgi:DNA-binding transcriptional LysR family regulator